LLRHKVAKATISPYGGHFPPGYLAMRPCLTSRLYNVDIRPCYVKLVRICDKDAVTPLVTSTQYTETSSSDISGAIKISTPSTPAFRISTPLLSPIISMNTSWSSPPASLGLPSDEQNNLDDFFHSCPESSVLDYTSWSSPPASLGLQSDEQNNLDDFFNSSSESSVLDYSWEAYLRSKKQLVKKVNTS
jgi:hypothetical protein